MLAADARRCSWAHLLTILACPRCGQRLEFQDVHQDLQFGREYGVLNCGCSRYPVVDGIPVLMSGVGSFEHTQGHVEFRGPSAEELVELVLARRGLDALLRCISFPITLKSLDRILPRWLWKGARIQEFMVGLRRWKLRRWCLRSRDALTAEDWLRVFCGKYSPVLGDMFNYFLYRLGQQHHLASLAVTNQLPPAEQPILDLACGFGHLGHNLTESPEGHAVVGADRNFFQVWTAQYWIAPAARFVCANADQRLPFIDGSFAATLCADAFHYFRNKATVLGEVSRCAPGGPILLTGVGNGLVPPSEGCELEPHEYLGLGQDPRWRVFGESELLRAYLHRTPVDFSECRATDTVKGEKWLTLVHPGAPPRAMQTRRSVDWPHAAGALSINPIYRVAPNPDKTWQLHFAYPSRHFAFENAAMPGFCPEDVVLQDETHRAVVANVRSPEVERLIEQMVVIGTPRHYTRDRTSTK